ncbi:MAG: aldo/keto reductase [Flavobacteriales bacterium CG_4_9_14_3_um_filter_40_17]|nr:MAG: aldo/keto reductase [Flavobacteriales bacterium CG_4_9_14_3_um_filter_40_17]
MKYTTLPNTDIKVSKICLGTMTWGQQNTESEGHEQMDYAFSQGVNFIDTAELYSVPGRKETSGSTERIIGAWLKKTGRRGQVILATKVAGPNAGLAYIRENLGFSKAAIADALNKSLTHLQTDYIDLYQLHWPERKANFFGKLGYEHDPNDPWEDNINEVLHTLNGFVKDGKIRHIGLSNETPWGVMRFLEEAKKNTELPRVLTVQNPYSLLNRSYEIGMAEVSMRSKVGLLAYSPLAFGVLSGKYIEGNPENGRVNLFPQLSRYNGIQARLATAKYFELAQKNGLSLAQMALAYINTQPFLTSNIVGATSLVQLEENIGSIDVDLSEEVLKGIQEIHLQHPNPAP